MKHIQAASALIFSVLLLLACVLPAGVATQEPLLPIPTVIAMTMQAISSAAALTPSAVAPTSLPSPVPSTPTPTLALPRTLYYLKRDGAGVFQIYRMERDGKTVQQITFEPMKVDSFDISPKDGSLVYISNNQLLAVDMNGAGRRVLLDGGPVTTSNSLSNEIGSPVWSPDGATIAFGHGGLNFYSLASGAVNKVLDNQFDLSKGFPQVFAIYTPVSYSPDGSKLLVTISYSENGTLGIYYLSSSTLTKLSRPDGSMFCCVTTWTPDGGGVYAASPTIGMIDSGLYYADATNGKVSDLLPGAAPDGTYNFADAPMIGPDGKLYFFYNNLKAIPSTNDSPLLMVRSASDGVTGRAQLRPESYSQVAEILWAPDASFAILAISSPQGSSTGGQTILVWTDGRPALTLGDFIFQMRWGK